MKWLILVGLIIVVVLEYAIISIGKEADEEADRMYREWVKKNDRMADRPTLDDGTLVVSVDDATAVTRVLVGDSNFNGSLYYADRPKGKWTIRFVKEDNGMGGTYRVRRWYCSACSGWQTYGETDFCPWCGAEMKGADDE